MSTIGAPSQHRQPSRKGKNGLRELPSIASSCSQSVPTFPWLRIGWFLGYSSLHLGSSEVCDSPSKTGSSAISLLWLYGTSHCAGRCSTSDSGRAHDLSVAAFWAIRSTYALHCGLFWRCKDHEVPIVNHLPGFFESHLGFWHRSLSLISMRKSVRRGYFRTLR